MTTMQEEVVDATNHLRRFWIATILTFISVIVISLVVGLLAGAHTGRLVFFAMVASSSVVSFADGVVARARRNRAK